MAKAKAHKREIHFELDEIPCLQGKYKNLEPHGNDQAGCWAVTFDNVMLPAATFNDLMADPHADRAMFNDRKGVLEPMPWLNNIELKFLETFEDAVCTILYSKNVKEKVKCELEFQKCEIKIKSLVPMNTGVVQASLEITLKVKRRDLILIHEHQHTSVKLSISDAKVAAKKGSGQEDMFTNKADQKTEDKEDDPGVKLTGSHLMSQPTSSSTDSTQSDSSPTSTASSEAESNTDDSAEFEAAAKKQVEAFNASGGRRPTDGRTAKSRARARCEAH